MMLKKTGKILKWSGIGLFLLIILLLLPVGYIETFCKSDPVSSRYQPIIINPEHQRVEGNSYLTYPEWHIVYAYEGLANVLEEGDEHELGYSASVASFWRTYCALNKVAGSHGGADTATRATIHTIGVSFTLEMIAKGLYEETIGRLAVFFRGENKTPQDIYASQMATDYAVFLRQTPWYEFDFNKATRKLWQQPVNGILRGWERRLALGGEWKAKSAYAKLIAGAVAATGEAKLTIHSVVSNISSGDLTAIEGVEITNVNPDQIIIRTPRYRQFTSIIQEIIRRDGRIIEIAGNDDIMVSAVSSNPDQDISLNTGRPVTSIARDGFQGRRLLVDVKVQELPQLLSELKDTGYVLEHIYDY